MKEQNWRRGPLGGEVETFIGQSSPHGMHSRAVFLWQTWLQLEEDPKFPEFAASLSLSQFNSQRILLELWHGRPADQQLLRDCLEYFQTIADSGESEDAPKAGDPDYRLPFIETGSAFQSCIFDLFMWEFFCVVDDESIGIFSVMLQNVRQKAANYMACSRLARRCFEPYLGKEHQWNEASQKSASLSPEHYQPRSSWKRDSISVGASLEPCPWLPEKSIENRLPYFLWDRVEKKTVVAGELKDPPNYIAISHTWGRWIIDGPPVSLLGTPWLIPQNMRFEVAQLAEILQAVPLPHRYIWLDLVCIPQDHSERANIEISRQAMIFREASFTIMWLSDVPRWKYLLSVIEWLCLDFSLDTGFLGEKPEGAMSQEEATPPPPIELLNSASETEAKVDSSSPNPWFTSLWTLQEICLRPDMLICNSAWEFLTIRENIPITFDELVALSQASSNIDERRAECPSSRKPKGVVELGSLLTSTGLSGLLTMSRPSILILGNHRHCLERRAEAIMAVMDATEWFSTSSEESNEAELVLNTYPIAFVNEVKSKLGPATFFRSDTGQPYFANILAQLRVSMEVQVVGSMLPFGPGPPKIFSEVGSDPLLLPHPSVDTWIVEPTGCVRIKEAVIVSSSRGKQ